MTISQRQGGTTVGAAVAAIALAGVTAWAQPQMQRPSTQQMQQMRDRQMKAMGITAAQKSKLDAIDRKYRPRIEKLQREMSTLMMQAGQESMAVLTPAQRQKMQQMSRPPMPH